MDKRAWGAAIAAGALALTAYGSLTASDGTRNVQIRYRGVQIYVNGNRVQTSDEPFIYDGRVYLPARDVANAFGADVKWDDPNSRVLLYTAGAPADKPASAITAGSGLTGGGVPSGGGAGLGAVTRSSRWRPFPDDNAWNRDISALPVDPQSDQIVTAIGAGISLHPDFGSGSWNGVPRGFFYSEVPGNQAKLPVDLITYADESDPGPYPIPRDAQIEGGPNADGDRHVIVVDRENGKLYELYRAFSQGSRWKADAGAVWDLRTGASRPQGWTSADAAGLPILPGLVRYDEVAAGVIDHALRFTVPRTRRAYVPPASHWASTRVSPELPPMGMRVRLKKTFDISRYSPNNQIILRALQTYGMILADNGSPWYISGANDPRWDNADLNQLAQLKGNDLEVVRMPYIVSAENFGKAPLIDQFVVSTPVVAAGGQVTLTWASTNGYTASLDGAAVDASGSLSVSPPQTTSYRLVVANPFGTAVRELTVTVVNP